MNFVERVLKAVDMAVVLDHYGVQYTKQGGVLRAPCVLHGGDNKSAFVAFLERKTWYCHTKCGEGNDVFKLVQKLEGVEFREAVEFLAKMFDVPIDWGSFEVDETYFEDEAQEFIRKYKEKLQARSQGVSTKLEGKVVPVNKFRTFDSEILKRYKAHVRRGGDLDGRLVFPIYNENKKLVAWAGRTIKGEKPKWKFYPKGFSAGQVLGGIHLSEEAIIEKGEAILVEGIFDEMKFREAGFENVVRLSGVHLTKQQIKVLGTITFKLILALDGDRAGREAMKKIIEKQWHKFEIEVIEFEEGKDPGDYDVEQLQAMYKAKIKSKYYNVEREK